MMLRLATGSAPLLSLSLSVLLFLLVTTTAQSAVTICPKVGSIETGLQYHADTTCDRAAYNAYKNGLQRHLKYQAFKTQGGIQHVPSQHTVKCPAAGARVSMNSNAEATLQSGLDTVWFIENQATTPIVLAYVNAAGMEVSAKNPHISPASADPDALLQPGGWMAVYATEGHEFVARQLLKSGVAGNVLLQHRPGLIAVGQNNHHHQDCPLEDVEPLRNETRAPEFARTPSPPLRPCHTMDVGFRNVAPCPLHAYYVSGEGEACQESFKFHLGVQHTDLDDYMWQWQSATKYEGTFVGHTFHFRLASNPTILVDTVTLRPVIVTDCPTEIVKVPVKSTNGGMAIANAFPHRTGTNTSTTPGAEFDYYHVGSQQQQQQQQQPPAARRNATQAFLAMEGNLHSF